MRVLLILSCVLVTVLAQGKDKYTDKYDNIDLNEILTNKRLLDAYTNCVLEKGKCNAEGKELKGHLKDALQTGCEKCTEKQEAGAYKVIEHMIKNEIATWKELVEKYDPDNKYRKQYEARARANGIVIPE